MADNIFISYRRENGGAVFAQLLYTRLVADGYNAFLDVEDLKVGYFNTALYTQIEESSDFLLVLPPKGLDRCTSEDDWVRKEIEYAMKLRKRIIPIMMTGFEFPKSLPTSIASLPNLNGIIAHMELFDGVLLKIKSMINAKSSKQLLQLETKEYYKVKTPLISRYKRPVDGIFMHELMANASKAKMVPEDFSSFNRIFSEPSSRYYKFYIKNQNLIEGIRTKMVSLMSDSSESGFYSYTNVLFYAVGSMGSISPDISIEDAVTLASYICGYPYSEFYNMLLMKSFDLLFDHFRFCYPLFIDTWVLARESRKKLDERAVYDHYCLYALDILIDITQLKMLINSAIYDDIGFRACRDQLSCYYKFLKKHKIYPPKEMQSKIYEIAQTIL